MPDKRRNLPGRPATLDFGVGRKRIHAVVFDDPGNTVGAVVRLRSEGFEISDVHSPFPVHGMEEALGLRESNLPWATLVGGAIGLAVALWLQSWTHTVDWPLNIGGKSNLALPASIPIIFELTVLFAAFATVGTLFARGRLFPRLEIGTPATQPHARACDDRFVVLVIESDAAFSPERFAEVCRELAPVEINLGWRVV